MKKQHAIYRRHIPSNTMWKKTKKRTRWIRCSWAEGAQHLYGKQESK